MPHFDELYPGRFLKGKTLERPMTIRIISVGGEKLQGDDGMKAKGILKYKTKTSEGEIVWCHTNSILTSKVLGEEDYTKWGGRLITIYFDKSVVCMGERVGGIRVYGGPDLAQQITVSIKRPRRKNPDVFVLRPTGKPQPSQGAAPSPAPAPPPPESSPALSSLTDDDYAGMDLETPL